MELDVLLREAAELNGRIKDLLTRSGFYDRYGLDAVTFDPEDREDLYALEHLERYLEKLKNAVPELDHVTGKVLYEGSLHRTPSGRYGIGDYDLSAGAHLEFLSRDARHNGRPYWKYSQVERWGDTYRLTAEKDTPLEGLYVRIRSPEG